MNNVPQNGTNGKVAVTTIQTADIEQMSLALNLPDMSTDPINRVQLGQVETGSEWDGWNLADIYHVLVARGDDPDTAAGIVDAIEENRRDAIDNPLGHRPAADQIEEAIAAEEPWYWA